jgi:hypothetical protein
MAFCIKPDALASSADSEEKHEPVSDIDTAVVDSLKVLDPERPIREEADVCNWQFRANFGLWNAAVFVKHRAAC